MFARTNTYTSDRNCKVVSELVPTARVSVPGPAKERGVCIGGEEHLVLSRLDWGLSIPTCFDSWLNSK